MNIKSVEFECPKKENCPETVNNGFGEIRPCNNCPIGQEAVIDLLRKNSSDQITINTQWIYDTGDYAPENYGLLYVSVIKPWSIWDRITTTHNFHADFNSGTIWINPGRPVMRDGKELKIKFPPIGGNGST